MRHLLFLLFISLFFTTKPTVSFGQDEHMPYHEYFSVEDGLPTNRIYDIIQDKKGYIWIGTDNGLLRFNGKEFKEFSTSESVKSEYSYIHELNDGSIWCINFGNQVFKISGDTLKVVDAFRPYINDYKYFKLYESNDSILYLENANRIIRHDPFENSTTEISNEFRSVLLGMNKDTAVYVFEKNKTQHLVSYNKKEKDKKELTSHLGRFIKMYHDDVESYIFSFSYNYKNDVHIPGYIYPFNLSVPNDFPNKNSIITIPHGGHHSINSITTLNRNPWCNTPKGAINTKTNKIYFPKKNITKTIIDCEQNYWMSSYHSGIIFIPNIGLKKHNELPLKINQIEVIDSSHLIVYSEDGNVNVLNVEDLKIKNTFFIDKINDRVLPILKGSSKLIVSVPLPFTLDLTNGQKSDLAGFYINLKSFETIEDHIIIKNGSNNITISHNDVFDKKKPTPPTLKLSKEWELGIPNKNKNNKNNNFKSYYARKKLKNSSPNIECIHYEDWNKRIWIAYTNKTSIEHCQVFRDFKDVKNKDLKLNCFANYLDKGVVAGLRDHGLIFIEGDQITRTISNNTYKEFGPIREIITTDSIIICLAKKGTIISDIEGNPLHTLDETDGLKGSIINDIQFLAGNIWFATNKGLFYISLEDIRDNSLIPLIHINHLSVNNERINDLSENNSFPNNSDIEINFEAFCYKGRNVFEYQYQLHNDDKWQTLPSTSSSVRFPNLSSGKYQFKIKAINEEQITSDIITLNFKILPPIWLSWWFLLGTLICILLALYYYNRRNLKKIEKENQIEKDRIEKENQWEQEIRTNKLSALQSRMNPHFIFNSLNSIQDFIIRLDKEGANEYLGIFSDLMRVYLTHSEKDKIELHEEIESLKLYLKLEELRFGDIAVDFKVDKKLTYMDIFIPPLFLQPYIENAFKHGLLHKKENKKLKIEFKLKQQLLIIRIEDNGVGRKKVQKIQSRTSIKGLSYATNANLIRLELLNHNRANKILVNTIDLHNNETPSGTLVEITIPILD